MNTARLRVVLRDVEPALARVIDVPASATLPELHELLQAAIGWTDSHLHQFVTPQATYGMEIPGEEVWPEDQRDETDGQLADLGAEFEYLYDFGDGWTHDVEVLGPGGSAPGCVDGHGACPPEDCGGPGGYAELLDVLADPAHPEHEHMRTWVGDRLRPFDRAATDRGCAELPVRCPRACGCCSISFPTGSNSLRAGGCHERWCAACNSTANTGTRSAGPPPSRTTCPHWGRCTSCCAASGYYGCATACSPPPAQPAMISP